MNVSATIEACHNSEAHRPRSYSVDEILASSWDRKLEEMRRFLALKGYRELLQRLQAAREGKHGKDGLHAVAHAMRGYALARPALSAAAFRTAAADCPEWREAHENLHSFMMVVFADCGLFGQPAEDALNMLRSLVRGYILNELMQTLIGVESYEESFESAIRVFIAGLSAHVTVRPFCGASPHPSRRGSGTDQTSELI